MPLLICFGFDNYVHAQMVDTRLFFLGRVGPGNEASRLFANGRNGGYLLWLETHARATKLLEGEEQCAIEVELDCLIQEFESCVD